MLQMYVFIIIFPSSISKYTDQFDVHKNRRQNARLCPWMHLCGSWSLAASARWTLCAAPHSALPTYFLLPTNL